MRGYAGDLGIVLTGHTPCFDEAPRAAGRSLSSHDIIVQSIAERLITLPVDTVVKTGHGVDTTIGAEQACHRLPPLTKRGHP